MERLGKVVEWVDARGYGFIAPVDAAHARLFFHIRSDRQDGRRPETGELVKYRAGTVDGRAQALSVRRAAARMARTPTRASRPPLQVPGWLQLALALGWTAALAWACLAGRLPMGFLFAQLVATTLAYMALAWDKDAAGRGRQRIPEANLHLLELAGGWPGSVVAQRTLRHKTRKIGYRVAFWTMVALNVAAVAGWVALRSGGTG